MLHSKQWNSNAPIDQQSIFKMKPYYFTGNPEEDQYIQRIREEMIEQCQEKHKQIFENKNKYKNAEDQKKQKTLAIKQQVDKNNQKQIEKLKQEKSKIVQLRQQRLKEKQIKAEKYDKKFESIKHIFKDKETYLQHVLKQENQQNKCDFKEGQQIHMILPNNLQIDKPHKVIQGKQQQEIPDYMKPDYPLNSLDLRKKVVNEHLLGRQFRCPEFGMEKTPFYQTKMENKEKIDRKKENINDLIVQGYLSKKQHHKSRTTNLDFKRIYDSVQFLQQPFEDNSNKRNIYSPSPEFQHWNSQNLNYIEDLKVQQQQQLQQDNNYLDQNLKSDRNNNTNNKSKFNNNLNLNKSQNLSLNYLSYVETTTTSSNPNKQYINKLGKKVNQFFTNKNHIKIKV